MDIIVHHNFYKNTNYILKYFSGILFFIPARPFDGIKNLKLRCSYTHKTIHTVCLSMYVIYEQTE